LPTKYLFIVMQISEYDITNEIGEHSYRPYGSWIYNYLCNQCIYSTQHYVIKFVSDLRQVGSFLRMLRFPHQ
jgi:hypothetical protein